ncbi:MAG: hypothetical protein ACJ71S_06455 [Acidobacteriaceae bacterium]
MSMTGDEAITAMEQRQQIDSVLTFSFRANRLAKAIADKTASRSFNKASRELWQVVYRNAFHAVRQEGPMVRRGVAIAASIGIAIITFALGLAVRGLYR